MHLWCTVLENGMKTRREQKKNNTKILSEDEMYTQTNTPPYSERVERMREEMRENPNKSERCINIHKHTIGSVSLVTTYHIYTIGF